MFILILSSFFVYLAKFCERNTWNDLFDINSAIIAPGSPDYFPEKLLLQILEDFPWTYILVFKVDGIKSL